MQARYLMIALFSLLSVTSLHGCGSSSSEAASPPANTSESQPVAQASAVPDVTAAPPERTVQQLAVADPPPQAAPDPAPDNTPSSPVNPLLGKTIRIMAIGDSMTAGDEASSNGFKSYRGTLHNLLVGQGYQVDFVGTQSSQPSVGGDPDHEGYGGAYIGPGGAANNLDDRLAGMLAANDADIIILAFGWNSVFNEGSQAGAKYLAIVNRIAAAKPQAHLLLATLSPMRGQDGAASAASLIGYRDLNAVARDRAGQSATDRVHLADFASGGFQHTDYWDVIHWLQPGADRAARILFEAILAGPLKG